MANLVSPHPSGNGRSVFHSLLWAIVGTSTAVNLAASFGGPHTGIHLCCGIVTALSAGTLAVRALRRRQQR
ncbi:hypothetical protein [Phaeacidiphilus oryzae]|jgi:hypothetical protein|uniref:hypothetical protein n=1 Tax=Phaeacidiphilus oryzae TaxID=348818 RepID=UPI000561D93E|nr:hypothetical protein [Phaeacidiphilus oryzae]